MSRESDSADDPIESVRLDVWLWAARFFKTRSLSKRAVETGKVETGGQRAKSSRGLRVGESLRVVCGDEVFEISVLGLSDIRGPASKAQALYRESDESRARREAARQQRALERNGYQPPESKPDKRARRIIRALGDIDAF
ncbi:MAG: RNA-binding protein [Xanthomonadaceae bacterium]|jgi:ribosome-associated heat shock protein Hsp15|nr:RNA-binding protein [Xanthomonadaceae bacterium]